MNETPTNSEPKHRPFWGHRQQVAALVIVHLGMTFLLSAAFERFWYPPTVSWSNVLSLLVVSGLVGFQIAQSLLLVCWVAFAGQPWFLRIPRFLSLAAWLFLMGVLGAYLVDGDIVKMLVEEFAAYGLLMILTPLVTLVAWSLWTGRRLRFGTAPHVVARQFSTAQLLLITTEAAALLALGRVVLRWNRNAADEFWMGLTYNGPEGLFPVFLGVTLLPVVYFGLVRNRTWGGGLLLALYIIASTLSLAWVRIFNSWGNFVPETADDWWSNLLLQWLDFFWADVSAAATILVTFWLLRRIGYDFRRRDDGPLGRNSSNARNSAASASA